MLDKGQALVIRRDMLTNLYRDKGKAFIKGNGFTHLGFFE